MLGSLGSSVVIHRIGHNSMIQMFSLISSYDSVSEDQIRPESVQRFIILFRLDTLSL